MTRTALLAALVFGVAVAAEASLSVSVSTTDLQLRGIDRAAVLNGLVQTASANLLVQSSAPWMVGAVLRVGVPDAAETRGISTADPLEIRAQGGTWERLQPDAHLPIASGEGTGDRAISIAVEIRLPLSLAMRPGRRSYILEFVSPNVPATSVRLRFEIPPIAHVEVESSASPSAVNPAVPGIYPFERRRCRVLANTPWVLTAVMASPLQKFGDVKGVPDGSLVVTQGEKAAVALQAGRPHVLASGEPTTFAEVLIEYALAIRVGDDLLTGGEYTTEIRTEAVPADAAASSVGVSIPTR